jgi:hypothetical protein
MRRVSPLVFDRRSGMQKGFFASLLDTRFNSLVTTRVIRVLYILALVGIAITALLYIFLAFRFNAGLGLLTLLVLAPLGSLVTIIYTRVLLEALIALFKIMENTRVMAEHAVPGSGARTESATQVGSEGFQGPGQQP